MDKTAIKNIINDTQALLEQVGPALEAQTKLAALEPEFISAKDENKELKKSAALVAENIKVGAEKAAAYLCERGVLPEQKTAEFVNRLIANPGEIFDVMQKFAENISVQEVGSPSDKVAAYAEVDPIVKFAMT
jgi:thymidine phosphorylase